MDNLCYIYTLTDPNTQQVRYVGKTINPKVRFRSHKKDKKGRSYRVNWIKSLRKQKLFPIFEILDIVDNNDWEFWEQYWICQFKVWGFKLVNANAKGTGAINFKHSEETKKRISISSTNRKHSEETKKLMSDNKKGIIFSDSHIENLRESHLGQKNENFFKGIIQINIKTGEIIQKFKSLTEAEYITGINNSSLSRCCKKNGKSAGGFYWCYECEIKNFIFEPYKRIGNIPKNTKKINQLDKNGVFINCFRSIKNAFETLNVSRKQISKCLKNNKYTAGGFKWEYSKL